VVVVVAVLPVAVVVPPEADVVLPGVVAAASPLEAAVAAPVSRPVVAVVASPLAVAVDLAAVVADIRQSDGSSLLGFARRRMIYTHCTLFVEPQNVMKKMYI
jgi:hypothetical protein